MESPARDAGRSRGSVDDTSRERCVYVKQALLDQLERDKRGLKWQLSRASKAADSRAAELSACEVKVKDLLTIVEMNKRVADRAIQQQHKHQNALRQVEKVKHGLEMRLQTQQTRMTAALKLRAQLRRRREWFARWAAMVQKRCQARRVLQRLLYCWRRRRLSDGWKRWTHHGANMTVGAVIYPAPVARIRNQTKRDAVSTLDQVQGASGGDFPSNKRMVQFDTSVPSSLGSLESSAHSQCNELACHGDQQYACKQFSFMRWKAGWLAGRRKSTLAEHFARLMLAKRVVSAWRHVLRQRNWRKSMVVTVRLRRKKSFFLRWQSWAQRIRHARCALCIILRRRHRRWQAHYWNKLRLKCTESYVQEWAGVLKSARAAMEEEQRAYMIQNEVVQRSLEESFVRVKESQQRFMLSQGEKVEVLKNKHSLLRVLQSWRQVVIIKRRHVHVAYKLYQHFAKAKKVRAVFTAWLKHHRHVRKVSCFERRVKHLQQHAVLRYAFDTLACRTSLNRAKRRAIRRVLVKQRRLLASCAFWRWQRWLIAQNEEANSYCLVQQVKEQLRMEKLASQGERLRHVQRIHRLQLQYALMSGDRYRARYVQTAFSSWKARYKASQARKKSLGTVLHHAVGRCCRMAFDRWVYVAVVRRRLHIKQYMAMNSRRRARIMRRTFEGWRCWMVRNQLARERWRTLYRSSVDRHKLEEVSASRCAAIRFFFRARVRTWQQQALMKWRFQIRKLSTTERNRSVRRLGQLEYVWHRWVAFIHCQKQRRLQQQLAANCGASLGSRNLCLALVWSVWTQFVRRRVQLRRIVAGRLRQKQCSVVNVKWVFLWWRKWAYLRIQQRRSLARLGRLHEKRIVSAKWCRWLALIHHYRGLIIGSRHSKIQAVEVLVCQHRRDCLRRCLNSWQKCVWFIKRCRKQQHMYIRRHQKHAMRQAFMAWTVNFMNRQHYLRSSLNSAWLRLRKNFLFSAMQRWKAASHSYQSDATQKYNTAIRLRSQEKTWAFVRRLWINRDRQYFFHAWRSFTRDRIQRKVCLLKLISRHYQQLSRQAWAMWTHRVSFINALVRLVEIREHVMKRTAFQTYQGAIVSRLNKITGCRRLFQLCQRMITRRTWHRWIRVHLAIAVEHSKQLRLASDGVLTAFLNRISSRHFHRSLLTRVFCRWRAIASAQMRLRKSVLEVLTRSDASRVRQCLLAWKSWHVCQKQRRATLRSIFRNGTAVCQRLAFRKWREYSISVKHQEALYVVRRALQETKLQTARKLMLVMFESWKRPTLITTFRAWRDHVYHQRESIRRMINRSECRRQLRNVSVVFFRWKAMTNHSKVIKAQVRRTLQIRLRHTTEAAFYRWHTVATHVTNFARGFKRLNNIWIARVLRRGFCALKSHRDCEVRRESMTALLVAQHAIQRQKKEYKLRQVAFHMQTRQHARLRCLFSVWRSYVIRRRVEKTMVANFRSRWQRVKFRRWFRLWREAVISKHIQLHKLAKFRGARKRRQVKLVWREWSRVLRERREVVSMLQYCIQSSAAIMVRTAWRRWQKHVETYRRQEEAKRLADVHQVSTDHRNRLAELENRIEELLLESVRLRRTMQDQRAKGLPAFLRCIDRVARGWERKNMVALWSKWKLHTDRASYVLRIAKRLYTRRIGCAFSCWKHTTMDMRQREITDAHQSQIIERAALMWHSTSVLARKKKMWLMWVSFVRHRRTKRRSALMQMLRRRHDTRQQLKCCVLAWGSLVLASKCRRVAVQQLQRRSDERTLRQYWSFWQEWRKRLVAIAGGLRIIVRLLGRLTHQRLRQSLWKWRRSVLESALTMAQTQAVIDDLDHWNSLRQKELHVIMSKTFAAWKVLTLGQQLHRSTLLAIHDSARRRYQIHRIMVAWKAYVNSRRSRRSAPVLCVQLGSSRRMNTGSSRVALPKHPIIRYTEYRHRLKTSRRLMVNRRVVASRMSRLFAVIVLTRAMRSARRRSMHQAFWMWFAHVQSISQALSAVDFKTLPWRRPETAVTGTMLLLTLEELDLSRQMAHTEFVQRALSVVQAIVRGWRRCQLQRAFDRLRLGMSSRRRNQTSSQLAFKRFTRTRKELVALGRALATRLECVTKRHAFVTWKHLFVQWALERAAQQEHTLLAELDRVTSRRRLLDPRAQSY